PQETLIELGVSQAFEGGRREITFRDANGERRRLTVGIPKGVREGQKIRLAGQASTGGDLFLVVKLVKDAHFDVRGPDLVTQVRIHPWDAVLGVAVTVPTLEGEVRIKVPPGSSGGRQIRLRGRGYPLKGGSRSDLYAELSIAIPESISDEQRGLWEQLRDMAEPDDAEV
ncbi:MAG: DnaJ C-terminal domain-containing protein, partial [Sandaracinaceae bacterium]